MSDKLTLTCGSVGAAGGIPVSPPRHVTLGAIEVLLTRTEPAARAAAAAAAGPLSACELCLSDDKCRHGCCCCCLLFVTDPLPGFRSLARLFLGRLRLSYTSAPPGPRDLCVKRSPLTSPDWDSFIRFLCNPRPRIPPTPSSSSYPLIRPISCSAGAAEWTEAGECIHNLTCPFSQGRTQLFLGPVRSTGACIRM